MPLERPEVDFPEQEEPTELVITDLVAGDGESAESGDDVVVHYVGVEFVSGEEFDASWNRGKPASISLRGLINGWQEGIPGMRVGGRRELIVPPEEAYGTDTGHRLGGKTLMFVIDLLEVG